MWRFRMGRMRHFFSLNGGNVVVCSGVVEIFSYRVNGIETQAFQIYDGNEIGAISYIEFLRTVRVVLVCSGEMGRSKRVLPTFNLRRALFVSVLGVGL